MEQLGLFNISNKEIKIKKETLPFRRIRDESYDFKDIPASTGIYKIHPYPAMFHFLVVRELIKEFSQEGDYVLDPFMGSGVVAGECLISNRNFIGFDINPLALLISKVRTTTISFKYLIETLETITNDYYKAKPEEIHFHNISYWFDEQIIEDLSRLRKVIFTIENLDIADFFKVAFSEAVRKVSKTRFNEFKLLRRKDITNNQNVIETFTDISLKNIGLLHGFYKNISPKENTIKFENKNILKEFPITDNSIDLVVTSPPYGDSKTTVAYGQFSRLSLRWLGFEENVDKTSLGSKPVPITKDLPSSIIYSYLDQIIIKDKNRSSEVFSFYKDLHNSIRIIGQKIKKNGYVCFAVGNRRVKGIELPTDKISVDFFENHGFKHLKTIVRAISNKRMPIKNAPSNIKGEKEYTMKYEYIVILKKY
jgi:hypothetical protein